VSLLELIVVMMIAGIAAFGASLSIRKASFEGGAQRTTREAVALMEQAALLAVASQSTVYLMLSGRELVESSRGGSIAIPEELSFEFQFGGSSGDHAIGFFPSGATSAGVLRISDSSHRCSITQTVSGARHWECPDAS